MLLLSSDLLLHVVAGLQAGFSGGAEEAVSVHGPLGATRFQSRKKGATVCLCWLMDVIGSAALPCLSRESCDVS